ncbi:hypothetical protein [Paraliobacillus zengyii]|uniref:hypothetical protein n=1 Tax=Paraliobacillus zengyii TaxID=2213194 RepID=UPI000DD4C00C|nr:hypothetical protein [Paraliobacillus zengyii]
MGKKKIGIIFTTLIIVTMASIYFYDTKALYGNNEKSIVKVINSIEGYENKQIKVLDMKDYDDIRIVGFLSDRDPAYIEFDKNDNGDYVWSYIESDTKKSFSIFYPLTLIEGSKAIFVTNDESKVARMQVDINGTDLEQTFRPFKASVTWLDLPQTNEDSYEFSDYKYFDKDENLIQPN